MLKIQFLTKILKIDFFNAKNEWKMSILMQKWWLSAKNNNFTPKT